MSIGAIIGLAVGVTVGGIIIGIFIGFAIGQKYFKKQMNDNPPITREQIKAMYRQMGHTPSEAQINQVMSAMKRSAK